MNFNYYLVNKKNATYTYITVAEIPGSFGCK